MRNMAAGILASVVTVSISAAAEEFAKPYASPCVERENLFEFTEKPAVKAVGEDRYEITFAVKGRCDVTVGIVDEKGVVVRHLASGVLGANAPAPFQKDSLKQTVYWNGKDDLDSYHRTPETLKVRVMLGLKPEFEKRLGLTNPKSIPGTAWGICVDQGGAYLFFSGYGGAMNVRNFDHDGNYVRTLFPLRANLPEDQLQGLGFVEYESGKRMLHSADHTSTWGPEPAGFLPHGLPLTTSCRPAIAEGRIYYATIPAPMNRGPSLLHSVLIEGAVEAQGVSGKGLVMAGIGNPCFAASPDGKWLYVGDDRAARVGGRGGHNAVFRCSLENDKPGTVFIGDMGKPGSDNGHFNAVRGIDCDTNGRLYVADHGNNRIQVFTADGKYAKTIPLDRPMQINVHRKTGAIYVMHATRVQGASVNRISKLTSYDNPPVECYLDCPGGLMFADSWTAKPRIWLFGTVTGRTEGADGVEGANVRILEEDGKQFRKMADFIEEVKAETEKAGAKYLGWSGSTYAGGGKMVCDPVREQVYFANAHVFDLKSGAFLRTVRFPGHFDDIAFDKRGYMHCHFNPSSQPGVGRLDTNPDGSFRECPYDYGEEGEGNWRGIIKTQDQLGAKYFQDGIGANMRGDLVEQCNIYWAPKFEEDGQALAIQGAAARSSAGEWCEEANATNARFVEEMAKRGVTVYSIRREPGIPLTGATAWTFDRNGELKQELAVNTGGLINGVQLDEEGCIYFVYSGTAVRQGRPFLAGKGGTFGAPAGKRAANPFTGTLMKTIAGKSARLLLPHASIPLEEKPSRPADLANGAWADGMQWLYAGASPIVAGGCSCPVQRAHLDWYKRTFVPEAYRHSLAVLDPAGNLILHVGQYGNFDSGYGTLSKVPVGGDGLAFCDARMLSGTDNVLCFSDQGYRIILSNLNYHAEASVPISKD